MSLRFTGDFSKLDRFETRLGQAPKAFESLNQNLAEESIELIREGFDDGTDPYGKAWPALVVRDGKPLQDSGGLKASFNYKLLPDGFRVGAGKDYAKHHQDGTGIYGRSRSRLRPKTAKALRIPGLGFRASVKGTPQRMMVPDARGLPPTWSDRYVETAETVLTHFFGD